jgi:AcrR family transcriptional regulator
MPTATPIKKPSTLRDRVRLQQRDIVLDVASELFIAQGFRATTLSAIAEKAGVGVATLFRYFRTKEGVLAALSRRDIEKTLARAREVAAAPAADPADAVFAICAAIFEMHRMPSTRIRGQTRIWLLIPTGHPETDEVVTSSDRELQDVILSLLTHYRTIGRLYPRLDLHDLTIVIFAVFYHHYLSVALDPTMKIEPVLSALKKRIQVLFTAWTVAAEKSVARKRKKVVRASRGAR